MLLPLALAEPAPLGWTAVSAEWTVTVRPEEPVRLTGRYTLASSDAHAGTVTLVGPELLILDAPGPVVATPEGLGVALNPDRRRVEQRVAGLYIPDTPGSLSIAILPAARTSVVVDAPGLDVSIPGAVDGWLPPTNRLSLSWAPHVDGEPTHVRAVVQGESATTFRGDAGAIAVDTVLRWKVLRGEVQRFTFDAAGLEELDLSGENIASWERTGNTVTVRTLAPVKGLLTVTVRGRTPPGKGERVAPTPVPTDVNRVDRYVTMARSDEGELIPLGAPASLALGGLPPWAKNLGDAAPLAAWHGADPVTVLVATAEVLQGPGTVVTAARYTVAASRDGRVGVRMNLRVRNEHRQYLHVVPPKEGRWTPIVIRVGNQPKSWLSDGAGGIYIPLERSVETVRGPLSFPVDAEWIAQGVAWGKSGEQSLRLPSVDAPVQAATWEVHLPRGYARVGAPKGGQEGFVLTDLRKEDVEAERKKEEVVSSALQNAVSAYRKNDFSGAEQWLHEAQSADADNEEVAQLQSNLDVLTGKSSTNDVASRRVRDLAKAKNVDVAEQQVLLEKEAEDLLRAGALDEAEQRYSEALRMANTLQQTEQLESVEQKSKISSAQSKLAEIADKKSARTSSSFAANKREPKASEPSHSQERTQSGLADQDEESVVEEITIPDPVTGTFSLDFNFDEADKDGSFEGLEAEDVELEEDGRAFGRTGLGVGGGGISLDTPEPEEASAYVDKVEVASAPVEVQKQAKEVQAVYKKSASREDEADAKPSSAGPGAGSTRAAGATTTATSTKRAPSKSESVPATPPPPPPAPPPRSAPPRQAAGPQKVAAPVQRRTIEDTDLPEAEPLVAPELAQGADAAAASVSYGWASPAEPMEGASSNENSYALDGIDAGVQGGVLGGLAAGDNDGYADSQLAPAMLPSAPAVPDGGEDSYIDPATSALYDLAVPELQYEERREYSRDSSRAERATRSKATFEEMTRNVAELAVGASDPTLAGTEAGLMAQMVLEQAREVIADNDIAMADDMAPFVRQALDDLKLAALNQPRPPRIIERREPLEASPAPMALAMPLDGPAVSTRQALLPGNTFPTWRLRYRRLPGESD